MLQVTKLTREPGIAFAFPTRTLQVQMEAVAQDAPTARALRLLTDP
jgi:hypothetical protein